MKPEYLRDLVPCEKCGRSAKVIDSRRVDMSQSRRRRIECQSCGHRSTRYEVSAAFYNQAIQNERVLHQLKLYIDQKSGVINIHVKDCNTCEYNDGKQCNFEVPEYDTEEATNCTYYQIRKWRTSPGKQSSSASA